MIGIIWGFSTLLDDIMRTNANNDARSSASPKAQPSDRFASVGQGSAPSIWPIVYTTHDCSASLNEQLRDRLVSQDVNHRYLRDHFAGLGQTGKMVVKAPLTSVARTMLASRPPTSNSQYPIHHGFSISTDCGAQWVSNKPFLLPSTLLTPASE